MIYRETEQGYEIIPEYKEERDWLEWLLPKIAPSDMNERLREQVTQDRKTQLAIARTQIEDLQLKLKQRRKRQAKGIKKQK